jgi:hypothetical protein
MLTRSWRSRRYNAVVTDESARAAARHSWPVARFRLGEEPGDDLSASTTAEERLAMVWPLTLEAWALSGRPLPEYERSQAPVRCVRRDEGAKSAG